MFASSVRKRVDADATRHSPSAHLITAWLTAAYSLFMHRFSSSTTINK